MRKLFLLLLILMVPVYAQKKKAAPQKAVNSVNAVLGFEVQSSFTQLAGAEYGKGPFIQAQFELSPKFASTFGAAYIDGWRGEAKNVPIRIGGHFYPAGVFRGPFVGLESGLGLVSVAPLWDVQFVAAAVAGWQIPFNNEVGAFFAVQAALVEEKGFLGLRAAVTY